MSDNNEQVGVADPIVPDSIPLVELPYDDKLAKAVKLAKHLLTCSDLEKTVELETIEEDDKVLAEMVKNQLAVLASEAADNPKHVVYSQEDIDKLPTGTREAIQKFAEQLGGIPSGGLFQVKLDSVRGLDEAVDTVIQNGTVNLGTIVCSKLAAERSAQIANGITYLVQRAHTIQEEGKPTAEDKALLKKIDHVIRKTFGENDLKCVLALCKELASKDKPKKKAAVKPTAAAPRSKRGV